ncbi:MAG TPA: FapA family protein [Lachnospiraceae bacterium]|nr:FapA family protein [Lachnospiraceae bacterium]
MNGYFQLWNNEQGTNIYLYPPTEDGSLISINEVMEYLQYKNVTYESKVLIEAFRNLEHKKMVFLSPEKRYPEQEMLLVKMAQDKMTASVRFFAPSNSGEILSIPEIIRDLKSNNIIFGINESVLNQFVEHRQYCKDIEIATGVQPIQGKDASVEYYFNKDIKIRPTLNEDGSVDFFHLNTLNHCKKGDILARLFKEELGEPGKNVCGEIIKQRDVKKSTLKFGKNISFSEDKLLLLSEVNGHVVLVDDKVFVSDIYEIENVDNATGNIEYEGSIRIRGTVCSNFSVKSKGNIEIDGVVEGAFVEAEGDIIIARGMNGMGKGELKAGGNIICKFLENAKVSAGGYIQTESILHSHVMSKFEVVVAGKRAFITGGVVSATNKVTVKTLGSPMGADTIIEVGIDPSVKKRFQELQKDIVETQKTLKSIQPVLLATTQKLKQGVKLQPEQVKYIQTLILTNKQKQQQMEADMKEMESLQDALESSSNAQVIVTGEVFPGTKIAISDVSMVIKTSMKHCKFIKLKGDVLMTSI